MTMFPSAVLTFERYWEQLLPVDNLHFSIARCFCSVEGIGM